MEHITVELDGSLRRVNLPNVVVNLIRMFQRHINTFEECQAIIQKKYPNLKEEDFAMLISELYEEAVVPHVATRSKGTELDYLKSVIDMLLHKFVPPNTFACLSGRFLLREILATQCVEPLVGLIANPNFINEIVIDILEPSLPLATILKQWDDAMKEIEDEEGGELIQETGNVMENNDVSSPETNYESTHEHVVKSPPRSKKSKASVAKHRNKRPRGRTKSRTDNRKRLFDGDDMSDLSGSNDDDTTAKDMIRFDKLDMKTSYPVYGSTSARDHEKSNQNKTNKDKLELSLKRSTAEADLEQMDSGRASYGREPSPLHSEEEGDAFESPTKEKGGEWAVCPPPKAEIFRHPSFYGMSLKQDDLSEQFKAKVNSTYLPNLLKQVSTSNCRYPCTTRNHTDSCSSMDMHIDGQHAQNLTLSVDGSVTMDFSSNNTVKKKSVTSRDLPTTPVNSKPPNANEAAKKDENEVVRVHKSGEEGAFYEVAPSCPTCIEMTLLASPFQNEKAQIVLSEREIKEREKLERWKQEMKIKHVHHNNSILQHHNRKKKIEPLEHECGLDSEHFCNAQADTESFTIDPIFIDNNMMDDEDDERSYASRSMVEDEILTDHSVSSGTLLASFEESMNVKVDDADSVADGGCATDDESSFDNISEICTSRSDVSLLDLDTSLGYGSYDIVPTSRVIKTKMTAPPKKSKQRKLSHAVSVQTFKTAIEGESVLDERTRQRSLSSASLDADENHKSKETLNKQFRNFFKKGLAFCF